MTNKQNYLKLWNKYLEFYHVPYFYLFNKTQIIV